MNCNHLHYSHAHVYTSSRMRVADHRSEVLRSPTKTILAPTETATVAPHFTSEDDDYDDNELTIRGVSAVRE